MSTKNKGAFMKIDKKKEFTLAGQEILMSPGEMVRILREFKQWSQTDLAKETGIAQTNISAIENNRVQIGKERAIILAESFGIHPSSIIFSDYAGVA